jgi:hypothetical protein
MSVASLVMVLLAGMMTGAGFLPCFGWLQWIAVPVSAATFVVGVVGLATDRDEQGSTRGLPAHLAALVGGAILVMLGAVRCLLGGGIL